MIRHFAQMTTMPSSPANRVLVLTNLAIAADRIDEARAPEARQRAEARLREKLSDEEVAAVKCVASASPPSPNCASSGGNGSKGTQYFSGT